jgi:hypothetical protein
MDDKFTDAGTTAGCHTSAITPSPDSEKKFSMY